MAASSSQTRIVPSGMGGLALVGSGKRNRQQHPEYRATRLRFTFDDAAMVGDDFGDQREPQTLAVGFSGDEGIENIGEQIAGNSRSIVAHDHFQRQAYTLFLSFARNHGGDAHARPIGGGKNDFAA